jgi:hypothetical protein
VLGKATKGQFHFPIPKIRLVLQELEGFVLPRHRVLFVYRRKYALKVSKGA